MRVMIGSFISSQKLSVQKRLERQFAKYMAYKRDANELLFYMLNGLVRDNLSYLEIYHSAEAPSSVDVTIEEFKQKVRLGGLQSRGGWQRCLAAGARLRLRRCVEWADEIIFPWISFVGSCCV